MKKRLLIIFFILITIFLSSSTIKYKPSFRLGINTGYYPIFYENSYNSLITSLDFGIFTAITINKFSFGVEISDLYYSYNSQNENNRLTGAYNTLNSSLILFYSPIKYLELKFGLGGSWFKSAFYYSNSNITSKNEGGITFLLDGYFYMPFKYINFEQKNSLSLFIHDNGLTPLYSGIVRINFKPYFEWINLYLEVGAKTFFYNENETKIESGSFVWGIGVNFDIKFSKFNKSRKRIILDTTTDILKNNDSSDDLKGSPSNTTDNTDDIKKQSNSKKDQKTELLTNNTPETSNDQNRESLTAEVIKSEIDILKEQIINKFNNSKKGDTLLETISFNDKNKISDEKSLAILNSITETLKQNSKLVVAIGGYSLYTGDPTTEIENAKNMALAIREQLEKNGIKRERIKILASGRVYKKSQPASERKIEIRIIEK